MFQNNVIFYDYELLQNDHLPTLILTSEGEILHSNVAATNLFGNYYAEEPYLNMDEPSYKKWELILNNIHTVKSSVITDFNMILLDKAFHKVTMEVSYSKSKGYVYLSVLCCEKINIIQSNDVINTSKHAKLSYRNLLQYVSKGVVITNRIGKIIDVNNCALMLLGKKRHELIFEMHHALFEHLTSLGISMEQYMTEIKENGHASCVMCYQTNNLKNAYLNFESVQDQSGQYVITTISDVTQKKMLQTQLEQSTSLQTIGQMAASIAHEIRNPMTSLLGFTSLLKVNASEEASKYLSVIESELHRIDDILNEMLILSKPRQRKMDSIDLYEILKEVANIMHPHASMFNCTIDICKFANQSCTIKGCQVSLKQVFINLLKNATEAMPNGGDIKISLSQSKNDYVKVSVIDQGTGIPEEKIHTLFQPFETTKSNGTGLGLPFVKEMVDEHGGEIRVQSKLGMGTTFTLVFPFHVAGHQAVIIN